MSAHTPGPWQLTVGAGATEIRGTLDPEQHGGVTSPRVCRVLRADLNANANARLIAAAPDLLDALQDLFDADMEHCMMGDGKQDQIEAIAKARAAVANATGAAA